MIIAQSICAPKRSRHAIRSSVNPLAGPGAIPIPSVSPASLSAAIPAQTSADS